MGFYGSWEIFPIKVKQSKWRDCNRIMSQKTKKKITCTIIMITTHSQCRWHFQWAKLKASRKVEYIRIVTIEKSINLMRLVFKIVVLKKPPGD